MKLTKESSFSWKFILDAVTKEGDSDCAAANLWGSSILAIGILAVLLAFDIPVATIEKQAVLWSVPWFAVWWFVCKIMPNRPFAVDYVRKDVG